MRTTGDRNVYPVAPHNVMPGDRSINLKMMTRHSCVMFVVYHTIEETPVCDAALRVAAAMVSDLTVHAAANVVELFVQTLAV
ncbi:hypothetical protein TNCV_4730361 [Trichonephila clavipes]|nr:hypothetical protein TNCV_4730361 [Trichonephila clavipes]